MLLGIVYALALYFKDNKFNESPKWSSWIMAFLRFLSVTGISILLLSPLVRSITEDTKQPIVVIAEDGSQSIVANLSEEEISAKKQEINAIADQLAEKYEVKRLVIGDKIENGSIDSFGYKVTNLSESLEFIYDNYGDQNLGAIIMSTDGIYNEGKNPLYANVKLTSPLYVVAQGDTTIKKDVSIKNVFNNKIAYLGDKFSIQIDIAAKNCSGTSTNLSVTRTDNGNTKRLNSENLRIAKQDYFNTREIIHGAHPDLTAMKSIITTNKNYEVDIHFPEDKDLNVNQYDLVVLHNLPSDKYPVAVELANLNRKKTPKLFVVGAQSSITGVNKAQDNIKIDGNSSSIEDIQADVVKTFNSFTVDDQLGSDLKRFPPLVAPFGQYSSPSGANILLKQNIKKISTDYPLLSFMDRGGVKTGVLVGEGIWKWRLFDFLQNENYDLVTSVLNKTIQFLSTKEDKRKFRVSASKNLYKENEGIALDAQLYNDNYEMINEPDVFVTVINQDKKEYKYTFSRASNYYTLSAGMLPAGRYRYIAKTNYAGEALEQKGSFSVQNIQLELYDLTARHDLLKALSTKYGGEIMTSGQTVELANKLLTNNKIKPVIYQSTDTKSVVNYKWLFGLLMLLLSLEWFLRRYMGSY